MDVLTKAKFRIFRDMKWIKRIILAVLFLIVALVIFVFYKGNSTAPQYDGQLDLDGLNEAVVVKYDQTGIPHIEAKNKADLYTAFGYVHAQDRLFQMELLRRAGSGRLAEIIGEPMIKVDKMFHTIGLPQYAQESAEALKKEKDSPMFQDINNYLKGINAYIARGEFSPEFMLMGLNPSLSKIYMRSQAPCHSAFLRHKKQNLSFLPLQLPMIRLTSTTLDCGMMRQKALFPIIFQIKKIKK
jgi:acyl-homoserine lactone acylase PvdQ